MAELRRLVATGKLDHRCVDAIEAHADEVIAIRDRFNDTLAAAPLADPHGTTTPKPPPRSEGCLVQLR